jgi:hypothetical protein
MDTGSLHAQERGLEKSLRATETLVTDGDDLSVRELIGLLEGRGRGSGLHLLLEVKGDVAKLLLDVTNDLTLGGGGERVTALSQDLHEVVSQVATSEIKTEDSVGKSITLIDGNSVRDTITRIHNDSGGTTRGVEGENGLDGNIHGGSIEGLEHDLGHLLAVGLGVEGGLSQEDGVLLRGNTQFIVKGVVPDLLHIVPVGNDTVLNGVLESQDTTLGLGLITDVAVLVTHTQHNVGVTGTTDDGREDGARSIISGETSLKRKKKNSKSERVGIFGVGLVK